VEGITGFSSYKSHNLIIASPSSQQEHDGLLHTISQVYGTASDARSLIAQAFHEALHYHEDVVHEQYSHPLCLPLLKLCSYPCCADWPFYAQSLDSTGPIYDESLVVC